MLGIYSSSEIKLKVKRRWFNGIYFIKNKIKPKPFHESYKFKSNFNKRLNES